MFKAISDWIKNIAKGTPPAPDPDGDELIELLFSLPDPIETMAPLGGSAILGGNPIIGQPTLAQTQSQARAKMLDATELFFVAQPSSMKALRDKGHIHKNSDGSESASHRGRSIPFFGYASASLDDRHWGLELRRLGAKELSAKELHALRESAAQDIDQGGRVPPKSSPSKRSRI